MPDQASRLHVPSPLHDTSVWSYYRQMFMIRSVEQRLLDLFAEGKLAGTVHTCIGQEACAVGVIGVLRRGHDIVLSNHRGHGHYLVHSGFDVVGLMGEVMGRRVGVSKGVGGTQQLHSPTFYSIGIQGSLVPAATGMAFAEKLKGTDAIVCACIGDGTLAQGIIYESFNIAAKWGLPILYVVEANKYAQTTPTGVQHAGSLADRAKPFGIGSTELEVIDAAGVAEAARRIVEKMRAEKAPHFLLLNTYRLGPHSKGDDHRSKEELDLFRERDPLNRLRRRLHSEDSDGVLSVEREVTDLVVRVSSEVLACEEAGLEEAGL